MYTWSEISYISAGEKQITSNKIANLYGFKKCPFSQFSVK